MEKLKLNDLCAVIVVPIEFVVERFADMVKPSF
jgi:hypothetical protein